MVINPLAKQKRDYADGIGSVERWYVDFVNGRTYTCKRVIFRSVEAMERAVKALERSAALQTIDTAGADAALSESVAETTTLVGSFHSTATAIAFFADGRELAKRAAHEMLAAVDPRTDNFGV